jgi:uncharacterized protein YecT (DUF1311 family)
MGMKGRLLALGLLFLPVAAMAQDDDCKDPQTQMQMNICAGQAYEQESAKLAAAVLKLRAELEPVTQTRLDEAQAKWQAFMEADCALVGSAEAEGGSMQPMVAGICMTDRAKERRSYIEHFGESSPESGL